RSDLHMSYAVCRMQKVKSPGLKGMQFHNQRERESRTNEDIDRERTHENYDLQNDENINYNERVKDIIDSQKTGTRKTRKDARSEEHTSELQSRFDLVCRLLLETRSR